MAQLSTETGWKISIIFITSCISIMLTILIKLLLGLYCRSIAAQRGDILQFIKILSLFCHTVAIIVSSLDLSHIILSKIENIDMTSSDFIDKKQPIMSIADAFYFIESISVYILIVGRLYFTFTDTIYALSKKYLYGLLVFIELNFKTMIIYFYYLCINNFKLLGLVTIFRIGFEVVLNMAVVFLFIHKLWQQIILMIQNNANRDHQQFQRTMKLIQVVTKYFLLSCILIAVNPSFYIAVDIVIFLSNQAKESFNIELGIYMIYNIRALELTIFTFILFLNFNFNHKIYNILCGKCHRCCVKLCIRGIGKFKNYHIKQHHIDNHSYSEEILSINEIKQEYQEESLLS